MESSDESPRLCCESDGGLGDGAVDATADGSTLCRTPPQITHGPVRGNGTSSGVTVWVRANREAQLEVSHWPVDEPTAKVTASARTGGEQEDFTGTVRLTDLGSRARYRYTVRVREREATDCVGDESEVRAFRTLPDAGPTRIRFATAADVNEPEAPGFDDIAAMDPDFVLMLGDNVYADGFGATFEAYRRRYDRIWSGRRFQALFSRVPAFWMWDDHEIVDNYWDGKNDDVYAFARRLYEAYQGSMNPRPVVEGDLYYTFVAGEVGFFVLDTRSHRSPNPDPDGPHKTLLGADQREALEEWLKADAHRIHVIVSSVIFSPFSTTGDDSWTSFATERQGILEAIHDLEPRNVIVISGDQHWSAVLRNDAGEAPTYSVYEFQTTPLAFAERIAPVEVDDSVLALDNTHRVFGVFDVDTTSSPATVDFTVCAVGSACQPGEEPAPMTIGATTMLPYTLHFEAGEHGLALRE